ncbi:type II toxin-antitoxin system PemK/MazF family toxin [Nakamurella sp. GG22]
MSLFSRLGDAVRAVLRPTPKPPTRTAPVGGTQAPSAPIESPGQAGPSATVEIDPQRIGAVRMTYSPSRDGAPDPGEIVWTWVPFEERDGRGKDRPVLVVAAENGGTYLGVQLTSKPHQGNTEFVPIGSGAWDSAGRPSWVNIDRVFRLHPAGMRRETAGLPARPFDVVSARLRERYGWR